jgi:hypothetical protein
MRRKAVVSCKCIHAVDEQFEGRKGGEKRLEDDVLLGLAGKAGR